MASDTAVPYVKRDRPKKTKFRAESILKGEARCVANKNNARPHFGNFGVRFLIRHDSPAGIELGVGKGTNVVTQNDIRRLEPGTTDIEGIQKKPRQLVCFGFRPEESVRCAKPGNLLEHQTPTYLPGDALGELALQETPPYYRPLP